MAQIRQRQPPGGTELLRLLCLCAVENIGRTTAFQREWTSAARTWRESKQLFCGGPLQATCHRSGRFRVAPITESEVWRRQQSFQRVLSHLPSARPEMQFRDRDAAFPRHRIQQKHPPVLFVNRRVAQLVDRAVRHAADRRLQRLASPFPLPPGFPGASTALGCWQPFSLVFQKTV